MSLDDRWRRWGFVAAEVLALAAVPVLAWIGFRAVLDTTAGTAVDPELDPTEPGYEAFVEPTPVGLLVGTDDEGALSWLTVVALGGTGDGDGDGGGAVVFVPPATVAEAPELGEGTLAAAWSEGGQPALVPAVADLLGVGFGEVVVLEPPRVAALLAPVAPLTITLADELAGFDDGEVALAAEEVTELLGLRAEGESDLARLARHESIWRAWLAAVAASSDPDVVPGEAGRGAGRYVRGLAAGPATFDVVPADAVDGPAEGDERFEPDDAAVAELVGERIPFPVGARPGSRPRIRVLDAVGADGLALAVARDAVRTGAQLAVVGNADRFGRSSSQVVYFDQALADAAADLAATLGIADVERLDGPNPNDLVDVTIVVGTDLAGAYGLEARTAGGDDAG